MDFPPLNWSAIRTYPLAQRANKATLKDFAQPHEPGASLHAFLARLPHFLAAADFKAVAAAMADAVRRQRPVLLMMGAHVLKCGLAPILLDAARAGLLQAVALNGAGAIHDFETALQGATSEDVQRGLNDGTFGMAEETGRLMNAALARGTAAGLGAGEALGRALLEGPFPFAEMSLLRAGVELGVPVTVHIALGTDIIHQHPSASGAVLGEASYRDFQRLASVVAALEGGVVLHVGSAALLPEVFLKALTVARNLGARVDHFTAAAFDMQRQYRAWENVVHRPTQRGGKGYYILGHHELLLPLLFAAVKEELASEGRFSE